MASRTFKGSIKKLVRNADDKKLYRDFQIFLGCCYWHQNKLTIPLLHNFLELQDLTFQMSQKGLLLAPSCFQFNFMAHNLKTAMTGKAWAYSCPEILPNLRSVLPRARSNWDVRIQNKESCSTDMHTFWWVSNSSAPDSMLYSAGSSECCWEELMRPKHIMMWGLGNHTPEPPRTAWIRRHSSITLLGQGYFISS